jgi:sulfite oxidase
MAPQGKRADTIVHEEEPQNVEPTRAALAEAPITAADVFYVRNHGPVPQIDPATWRLRVHGLVELELELGLDDLRDERFPERELAVTLQCAGNRRADLMAVRDIPGESPWGPGATGTVRWRGVALADVLAAARPKDGAAHVGFEGADLSCEVDPPELYGSSIPMRDALAHDVLLAWSMNGEPLPAVHGGPIRAVVPGYIGARSVKWLNRVELRAQPWDGHYQATAYRLVPPGVAPGRAVGIELGLVAVNSDVLVPDDGATVEAGPVEVSGYAFAGGRRKVERVDVSLDRGRTWRQAELGDDLGVWAWRLWRTRLELDPGDHEIVVRAWDSAAGTQPEDPAGSWNPKGYANNSWGRVRVHARP